MLGVFAMDLDENAIVTCGIVNFNYFRNSA
jgi:hypothetical protein